MKATPQWPKLGPQLGESFHLKVRLEGHVTLPHFKDVNIFIDVTLGWPPLAFLLTPFPSTYGGINYFPIKGAHLHYVFVFSMHEVLPSEFFVFT
jgi:hypothetical protein